MTSTKALATAYLIGAILALVAAYGPAVVDTADASEATGARWGNWHRVELPSGKTDRVRVKHLAHGTRCDFERTDRLDVRLVSIGISYRACVPSGEEAGD